MSDLISRKGVFIPDITVEMFRNASLESIEDLMASGEMEDILLSSVQPDIDKQELTRMITAGIIATNTKDVYSCGMRNGMRWCRGLLEEDAPKFEDASLYAQPETHDKRTETHSCDMIEKIGRPAMLEQLAEEASELAQACLKLARKERGENPTPNSKAECERELIEEFTDVIQCARELKLKPDEEQIEEKAQRFLTRWIARTQSDIEKKKHIAEKLSKH